MSNRNSLKGLVRNLLAVSRWGVPGWVWLWSVTEVTLEWAEERETIDGESSVLSPKHRQNSSQASSRITFPWIQRDNNTHAHTHTHTALTSHTLCVARVMAWNLQAVFSYVFICICSRAGKMITGTPSAEVQFVAFSLLSLPLNKPPVYL